VVDLEGPALTDRSQQLDVVRALAPARRAIGIRRLSRAVLLGFGVGAAAGAAVLGIARIHAFDPALPIGVAVAVAGIAGGAAAGLWRWPRVLEAARAADARFNLHDRLTTALELRSSELPLAVLQRRDAAGHLEGLRLSRTGGRWLGRREGAAIALAAMAFAAALALGAPGQTQRAAVAASSDVRTVRRAAAAQVKQLTSKLNAGLTPSLQHSPTLRQLDLALAWLRHQLLQAASRRAALRAISSTQQQLAHEAALGLHPINAKAVAQLNGSLGRYLRNQPAGLRRGQTNKTGASANAQLRAATQALNRLAQSLAHLNAAQRAALARALAQAANATSNNTLRSQLQQAASALANNDPQTARSALQQAAQALAQSPQQQATLSRLQQAGSQLNSLKNQLSGVTGTIPSNQLSGQPSSSSSGNKPGTGALGTGAGRRASGGRSYSLGPKPGSGKGQGRGTGYSLGTRPGQGQGQGNGLVRSRGTGGRGRGVARGQATGHEGAASSPGQTTTGAHGTGGRGRTSRTRNGHSATVYIPVPQGKGKSIIQTGPNGAPQPGAIVPYQQVIGRYTQSAHQALDRSVLPPSLQGYVKDYFSAISR
jgi:hypothetical protein